MTLNVRTGVIMIALPFVLTACSGAHVSSSPQQSQSLATYGKRAHDVKIKLPSQVSWTSSPTMTSLGVEKTYYPELQNASNWTQAIFIQRYADSSSIALANKQIEASRQLCPSLKILNKSDDAAHNIVVYTASNGSDCSHPSARNKDSIVKVLSMKKKGVVSVQYSYVNGKVSPADIARGFDAVRLSHI